MRRRMLVIDDTQGKVRRVKIAAEKAGFEVEAIAVLETAKKFIRENEVEAIVLDEQFFLREEAKSLHGAGEELLEWLETEKMEIPVLGFSHTSFQASYPYFWGQMGMTFEKDTFQEFISSLKDQSN